MASNENHIIYTAEDIQKYFDGKLASAEMHAMEKAALDDAFLAEAMEGYGGVKQKDWENELKLLRSNMAKGQIAKVVSLKPARRYIFWKAAAAIIILCSGVALTYMLTRQPRENNSIAVVKTEKDPGNDVVAETVKADTPSGKTSTISAENEATARNTQPPVVHRNTGPAADSVNSSMANAPALIPDSEALSSAAPSKSIDDATAGNDASLNQPKNAQQKKLKADKVSSLEYLTKAQLAVTQKFMAQVVSPDGTPLPFANISITSQNVRTYADVKGNFRLISTDSLLNIEVKAAGYITKSITLKSDMPENKIVLAEDKLALKSKPFVSGKTTASAPLSKRKAILVPDSVINVEPEDGWDNYNTYITNNLAISDNILQSKTHGQVEVSFEVHKDGIISNMKIDKSLCDDCDKAALKVIKQGPRWKVKKGNQGTAKVKVKF